MKNVPPTRTGILEAVLTFIKESDFDMMKPISIALNEVDDLTHEFKAKFCENLVHYDTTKVIGGLILLEYLTVHSTDRLSEIVNTEKFIDFLPPALFDEDLRDPTLNICKLWADKYSNRREELKFLFDFLEGLPNFGISLPYKYKSTLDDLPAKVIRPMGPVSFIGPQLPSGFNSNSISDPEVSKLKDRFQDLTEEIMTLYMDGGFEASSKYQQREVIQRLLKTVDKLSQDIAMARIASMSAQAKPIIEELNSEIFDMEVKLREMKDNLGLDDKEATNNSFSSQASVESVENNGRGSAPGSAEKLDYEEWEDNMMDLADFVGYKTEPCPRIQFCLYSDLNNQEDLMDDDTVDPQVLNCPFWHSGRDMRRPIMTEDGKGFKYLKAMCIEPMICREQDECNNCHNPVEKMFHPNNYKKDRCVYSGFVCPNRKYCPNHHSEEEKKAGQDMIKRLTSEGKLPQKRVLKGKGPRIQVFNTDGNKVGNIDDRNLISPMQIVTQLQDDKGKGDDSPVVIFKNEDLKGHLHARLTIRKGYIDPNLYTEVFKRHSCFSGMPFIGGNNVEQVMQDGGEVKREAKRESEGVNGYEKIQGEAVVVHI